MKKEKLNQTPVDYFFELILKLLRKEGVRITPHRRLVVQAVSAQVGWHVHAKSVYSYVHEKDPGIGIATVYRTLKLLDDFKILDKVYKTGIKRIGKEQNYCLVCAHCGSIHEIKDELFLELKENIKKDYNFSANDITIYGLCGNCKKCGNLS